EFREWLEQQRWYASKSRRVTGVSIAEQIPLCDQPHLVLALLEAGFATGAHELYQVPVVVRAADEPAPAAPPVSTTGGWSVYDALHEPGQAGRFLGLMDDDAELETDQGSL